MQHSPVRHGQTAVGQPTGGQVLPGRFLPESRQDGWAAPPTPRPVAGTWRIAARVPGRGARTCAGGAETSRKVPGPQGPPPSASPPSWAGPARTHRGRGPASSGRRAEGTAIFTGVPLMDGVRQASAHGRHAGAWMPWWQRSRCRPPAGQHRRRCGVNSACRSSAASAPACSIEPAARSGWRSARDSPPSRPCRRSGLAARGMACPAGHCSARA